MSYLLELLGRGLQHDTGDLLDRYFWSPPVKSVAQLQEQCKAQPLRADLHCQLGLAMLRSMQMDEAQSHLAEACRLKPDGLAARLALAAVMEEKGERAAALEQLQQANQVQPGEAPILFATGFCLERLGRPEDACQYYRDTVKRDSTLVAARERLAAVALALGKTSEAIEQYQELRKVQPDTAWVRTALAHLYFRDRQYSKAVEEFEAAIAMEPENWSLVDDEVEALVAGGQVREAIERLHRLLEKQQGFADLHVRLADLYSQVGDDDAAMRHYRQALEIQPDYLEAAVKVGTHDLAMGRWEDAGEAFGRASELNDALLTNYVGLGVAQAAVGNLDQAGNSFDLAAAIEPNSTLLLAEVARLHLKAAAAEDIARSFPIDHDDGTRDVELDNDDLLRKQLDRHADAVAQHPDHADLRYRYGVLLRAEGRAGEAIEQFAKAVEINPSYVKALIKLGITQQELGLTEQAIETFGKVLAIRPQFVDVHYRLGLLYTDRRDMEAAVKHMEAASDGAPDNEQIRAGLALSLQNMGLMDRTAATWRSLWKIHNDKAKR